VFGERSINWAALFLILLLVGGGVAGITWHYRRQVDRQAQAVRAQIARAEKGEDDEKLETLYERLLRLAPRDAETLDKYGMLLSKAATTPREKAQAVRILDRAVRENTTKIELRQALVDLAVLPGFDDICNPDPHLEILRTALPNSAAPCERLAARAEARGDNAGAEALLLDGMKRDKTHFATRLRLARLWRLRMKQEKKAEALATELEKEKLSGADRLALAGYWRDSGDAAREWAVVSAAQQAFPDDPDVLLASARSLEERADRAAPAVQTDLLRQAREALVKGAVAAPKRFDFYVRRAYLDVREKKFDEARQVVEKGLSEIPSNTDLHWAKCEVFLADGRPAALERAEPAIKEFRALNPPMELSQYLEARLAFANRRWVDAVQKLETVAPLLAREPTMNRRGLLMLGSAYRELGEPVLREMAYRRLIASEPLNIDAYVGLGEALADQRRYTEAITQLAPIHSKVSDSDRGRVGATLLISLVRREAEKQPAQRRWTEVDRLLDEVDKSQPNNTLVLQLRVERLSAEKKFDEAIAAVDRFVAATNAPAAGRNLAIAEALKSKVLLFLEKKDEAGARAALELARKKMGDGIQIRLAETAIETAHGLPKDLRVLDRLAERVDKFESRDRFMLWRGLALIRHSFGDERGALDLYRRASSINPQDQRVQRARFLLALDAGDLKQAGDAAEKLAASNAGPGSPAVCARALLELEGYENNPRPNELRQHAVNLIGNDKFYQSWVGVPRAVGRLAELESKSVEALRHYEASYDPKAPSARLAQRVLQLYERNGDYESAEKWLTAARLEPADPAVLRVAAEVAVRAKNYEQARLLVARAAPSTTEDPEMAVWGGTVLQAARAYPEAEALLRRGIAIAPTNPRPLIALVEMLARQNRKADAKREFDAHASKLPSTAFTMARVRFEEALGNVAAARDLTKQAIQRSPNDMETVGWATDFFLRHGDLQDALVVASKFEQSTPPGSVARERAARVKGVVLLALGKTDDARKALQVTGRAIPGAAGARDLRGDVRARAAILAVQPNTSSWRDALVELKRLEAVRASTLSDQLMAAQIELNLGDWTAARARLMSLAQGPEANNAQLLATIVRAMIDHGEPAQNVENRLRRLEADEPDQLATIYLRARFLAQLDRTKATAFLEKKVGEKKVDRFAAGMMLAEMNDQQDAATFLKAAAADVARNPTAETLTAGIQATRALARSGKFRDAYALAKSMQPKLVPPLYAQLVLDAIFATADEIPKDLAADFVDWLQKQLTGDSKQYGLKLAAAAMESRLGRHTEALERLRVLKAEMPETDLAYPSLINTFAYLTAFVDKKPEIAEPLLAAQVAKNSSQLELRDTLCLIRLQMQKLEQALADLQELSVISPKGSVLFHLALAQQRKGMTNAARTSLDSARRAGFQPELLHELERPLYRELEASLKR